MSREFVQSLCFGYRFTTGQVKDAFKVKGESLPPVYRMMGQWDNGKKVGERRILILDEGEERYSYAGVECDDDYQAALDKFCTVHNAAYTQVGDFYSAGPEDIDFIIEPAGVPGKATLEQLMRLEDAAVNLVTALRDVGLEPETGPLVQVAWAIM